MRKLVARMTTLIMACALIGAVGIASAQEQQTIGGKLRPKRLFKKGKRKTVSLFVNVASSNPSNPYALPSPTTLAKVDFDKDVKIQNKGLDTCAFSRFSSATTTSQAQNICHSSMVGGGSSTIALPTGPSTPPLFIHATVTAFNATHNRLVLHTYNQSSGATTLVGRIRHDRTSGHKFGQTLIVPVPPLAGGTGVITQFDARVKRTYRYRGHWRSLVSATCRDHKILFQARFSYQDGTSARGRDKQRCKPIRRHRH